MAENLALPEVIETPGVPEAMERFRQSSSKYLWQRLIFLFLFFRLRSFVLAWENTAASKCGLRGSALFVTEWFWRTWGNLFGRLECKGLDFIQPLVHEALKNWRTK